MVKNQPGFLERAQKLLGAIANILLDFLQHRRRQRSVEMEMQISLWQRPGHCQCLLEGVHVSAGQIEGDCTV